MWEPGNRSIVVLVTAISLSVFLYKAWGPVLLLTIALILVISTCYSLLINDSVISPLTLVLLHYSRDFTVELCFTLRYLFRLLGKYAFEALEHLKSNFGDQEDRRCTEDMTARRSNVYRLSSDFSEQPSPIVRGPFHLFPVNGGSEGIRTSTPLQPGQWKKEVQQNGPLGYFTPTSSLHKKVSPNRSENKQPSTSRSEETVYSTKGAAWSNNVGTNIRDKTSLNSIQTVAVPLINSFRYNVNPKIYTDVNSPGFTTRLNKYASEANNKLSHQTKYSTGQFPKVNLYANPTPILNPKAVRNRAPVTVRIAPPETIPYTTEDSVLSEKRSSPHSLQCQLKNTNNKISSNMVQVLKEISLKRHASREDMLDLVKKPKTDNSDNEFPTLEDGVQKRARDEALTSDEDLSPQSKTQRPLKRTKASSCHDILNSLSSSINVTTGVKRKIMDTSRCETPEFEKHFKPAIKTTDDNISEKSQSSVLSISEETSNTTEQKNLEKSEPKIIEEKRVGSQSELEKRPKSSQPIEIPEKVNKEVQAGSDNVQLTDKLFMKAEPQNNEKLMTLIKEQGNIEAKFDIEDKDEIKKQDICNMRQNSMRLRLQNMFDAISGKSANKIDPDVVIQAEDINPTSTSSYTSLSSVTSTTTVNTSPITSPLVPILKSDTDTKSPTTKHVTFNLSTSIDKSQQTSTRMENTTIISGSNVNNLAQSVISNSKESTNQHSKLTNSIALPSTNFNATQSNSNYTNSLIPSTSGSNALESTSGNNGTQIGISSNLDKNSTNVVSTGSNSSGFSINKSAFVAVSSIPSTKTTLPSTSSSTNNTASFENSTSSFRPITTAVSTQVMSSVPFSFPSSFSKSQSSLVSTPSLANAVPTSSTQTSNNTSNINFSSGISNSDSIQSTVTTTSSVKNFSFGNSSTFSFGTSTKVPTENTSAPVSNQNNTASVFGSTFANPSQSAVVTLPSISAPISAISSNNSAGSNTFGNIVATSGQTLFGTNTPNQTSKQMSFGTNTVTSKNNAFEAKTTTSTSFFATPISTISSFTANHQTNSNSNNQSNTMFGTPLSSSNTSASPFNSTNTFNATTAPTMFSGSTASTTMFSGLNVPSTTASSTFNASTNFFNSNANNSTSNTENTFSGNNIFGQQKPLTFGSGVPSFNTSNTTTVSTTTNTSTNSSSLFNMSAPKTVNSLPAFSTIKTQQNQASDQTSKPSLFGQSNTNFPSVNNSSIFGNSIATSTFGSSATTTTSPAFGGINVFGNSSATPTSTFGSSNAFGAPATTSTSAFGSSNAFSAPAGLGTPAFGNSNTFGSTTITTSTATPPAFGSSNTFGGQTSSVFGSTPSTTLTTTPFGSSQPSLFGNTGSDNKNNSSAFSFGGKPTQKVQPSLEGNNTNNPSQGLFQFGTNPNQPKPGGFNFGAPNSTASINFSGSTNPPAFNAPAVGMFSIGSGSPTPRSRTSRQRRQR